MHLGAPPMHAKRVAQPQQESPKGKILALERCGGKGGGQENNAKLVDGSIAKRKKRSILGAHVLRLVRE